MNNSRRGRPPKIVTKPFAAKLWSYVLAQKIGVTSGYGIEKYLHPEKFEETQGIKVRSCIYDKYFSGACFPKERRLDFVESKFPGTKYYAIHPFYKVANPDLTCLDELYAELTKLRPEIVNLLFFTTGGQFNMPVDGIKNSFEALDILENQSDWDALTACVGIIQEQRIRDDRQPSIWDAKVTYKVFCRFISQSPFTFLADELFLFIWKHFLPTPSDENWHSLIWMRDILNDITYYRVVINLLNELNIFKHHSAAPYECLYIAEKYVNADVFELATQLMYENKIKEAKKIPQIRNMIRSLKRWEKQQIEKSTFSQA